MTKKNQNTYSVLKNGVIYLRGINKDEAIDTLTNDTVKDPDSVFTLMLDELVDNNERVYGKEPSHKDFWKKY